MDAFVHSNHTFCLCYLSFENTTWLLNLLSIAITFRLQCLNTFLGGTAFYRKENGSFIHNIAHFPEQTPISFVLFSARATKAHILRPFISDLDPEPAVNEHHFIIFVQDVSPRSFLKLLLCQIIMLCWKWPQWVTFYQSFSWLPRNIELF